MSEATAHELVGAAVAAWPDVRVSVPASELLLAHAGALGDAAAVAELELELELSKQADLDTQRMLQRQPATASSQ